jgi:hypothetical protein
MRHLLLPLLLALGACSTPPETPIAAEPPLVASATRAATPPAAERLRAAAQPGGPQEQPLACTADADCVVKNVGNCCGYFPQCVHRDQPVDPAAVKERCEREGRSSICGFEEPAGCACVQQQCRTITRSGTN